MASPKASKEDQVQAQFTKLAPLIKGQQHKKAVKVLDASEFEVVEIQNSCYTHHLVAEGLYVQS